MKKIILLLMFFSLMLSSCASIFTGSKDKVLFHSDRVSQPVDLTIDGRKHRNVILPYKAKVKKGFKPTFVLAETEGYEPCEFTIDKKFNVVSVINLSNFLAWGIDAATGAMMKPEYKEYYLDFQPDKDYFSKMKAVSQEEDITIPEGEAEKVVSRDNPGQTALERTIIRWYFESAPQGARIFWRVISSIPDQVKNTNELWLGTTPFEETRSFNILGLTYENSRDVQIEIKVRRQGYIDQVKRFNVRQAIDQQEISSFFDMVKIEE